MNFNITSLLLLYFLLSVSAFAETPNIANPTKPGTEAIVAGIEGCQKGFEKGRRALGKWTGSSKDQLLASYFCSCQFDAKRKFPTRDLSSSAQACLDDASLKVSNSKTGAGPGLSNLFDKEEYPYFLVLGAFYTCEQRELKNSAHKWPKKFGQKSLYCSCVIDHFQDDKGPSLTNFIEGRITVPVDIEKKCVALAKTRPSK